MFRKPIFWIVFAVLVASATVFCLQNFDKLMGFINLEITMDRTEALKSAAESGAEWTPDITDNRQAVAFQGNSYVQYYIELEAGGIDAYNEFLAEGLFQPYQWTVRHFIPDQEREAFFYYTPDGKFYGFEEEIPETEPGNNIDVEKAQTLAEAAAIKIGVDLANFDLAETKTNEVLSGRLDYSFVYERPQLLGKARYRLRLDVSGDRVTAVYRYMHIPEAFSMRYREMRSANNTIASVASYGMLFFYGLLGIGLGSFLLLRAHYLLYKRAIFWAFVVSFLGFLAGFNQLPISWMWYDTAISPQTHITQTILMNLMGFIQDFILLGISFIAAESLTRKAFPDHAQFWKTLSPQTAPTKRSLGNVLGGYGMVPVNLALVLGFYLFTASKLGWWNPAGLQVDPNFIAMPMPWLSVLSQALHAGFWEESLFRAIPLAGMILIGRKFKKEKLFLVIGLILQALIFSAGHANYAAQPSYARVVELIIPSLIFAFLYLRFGLFTGIILHFVFDAVLMAMYIWIMKAPGIWFNRIMVLVGIFLPLIIILFYRIKKGSWQEVKDKYLNKGWKPKPQKPKIESDVVHTITTWNPKNLKYFIIIALAGILCWASLTDFSPDQPKVTLSRAKAIEIAENAFAKMDSVSDFEWRTDASFSSRIREEDKMVWQNGGEDIYHDAMGKFIREPAWLITFRSFEGDVADRVESYYYTINNEGRIEHYSHRLPEDKKGNNLTENEARILAQNATQEFYQLSGFNLTELSVSSEKHPNRVDWVFTWKDTLNYPLEIGEYRYTTDIRGDRVMSIYRSNYVPEEWSRTERNRLRSKDIFNTFTSIFMIMLYLTVCVMGIVSWSGGKFNLKVFYFILILMVLSTLILRLNQWQAAPANFATSNPWNNQVLQYVLSSVLHIFLLSFVFALIAGFLGSDKKLKSSHSSYLSVILGAIAFSGISALAEIINPGHLPWRIGLPALGYSVPMITPILETLSRWVTSSLLFIFIIQWLKGFSHNGEKKSFVTFLVIFAFILVTNQNGLVYGGFADFAYLLLSVILRAVILSYVFHKLLVHDLSILPLFMAVTLSLSNLKMIFVDAYNGAVLSNILAIVLMVGFSMLWIKLLRKSE